MIILELTIEQKDSLIGQEYTNEMYFNPIKDLDGTWVISIEERDQCTNSEFTDTLNSLPEIEFKQPNYEI